MKRLSGRLFKYAGVVCCAALLTACNTNSKAAKNLVNKLLKGQGTVVKQFSATANLEGFVVSSTREPARETIVYADKGGKYLVVGNIIGADGKSIAQQDYQTYITSATAPAAFRAAASTNWFLMGKKSAPHKTYMIVEPNCSACHIAYEQIKPMIASGQLAVRFITVAFLKADSLGKAAAILTSKNPAMAFASDEKGFVMKTESGGITPLKNISPAVKAKIEENITFMQKHRFAATPVFLYKATNGQYKAMIGFPRAKTAGVALIKSMSGQF